MLLQKQAHVLTSITRAPTTITLKHRAQANASRTDTGFAAKNISAPSDSTLPGLETALDNVAMTAYLRPKLPLLAQARNMQVSSSQLLDCKPGKRALVRYDLTTPRKNRKLVVFGKVYSQIEQLMRADQVTDSLWYEVFDGDEICSMPQPLGLIPELSMHLYLPAEGKFLDTVLATKEAAHAMQLTAQWMAKLHSHSLQLTKRFDLANELKSLAKWADLVGQTYPEMAKLTHGLLSYLQQRAARVSFATATPIHKDFHYRHVLVGEGVKAIDFDEVRLGDPNFDLAHFCANLHLLADRQHGSPHAFRTLEQHFLRTYAQRVGQTWPAFVQSNREQFRFFYVYTCIKIARQLCLGVGPSPAPRGEQRHRQVQIILQQGKKLVTHHPNGSQATVFSSYRKVYKSTTKHGQILADSVRPTVGDG